jgi:hypothetical protein
MFGIQVFEAGREPLRLDEVPANLISWLQDIGGWAAFGLVLWLLVGYSRMRAADKTRIPSWESKAILVLAWLSGAAYSLWAVLWLIARIRGGPLAVASAEELRYLAAQARLYPNMPPPPPPSSPWSWRSLALAAGGLFSLVAVCLPIVRNLSFMRLRRIWALTRLSFKESIRSRALYAFSALLVVFLFASWFIPYKPEAQVRTYVHVVFWVMGVLLLFTVAILASFSIPNDGKNQTIHTIVTKPVERFEILLGRFFGFILLMTLVLAVMTTLSLVYVLRGIDPAAAAESLKARDPLYGDLQFEDGRTGARDPRATSVGREWDYRSYISGGMEGIPRQVAVWDFASVPRGLAGRPWVRCEFGFDIYRTTKGRENRGVPCSFSFQMARFANRKEEYQRELEARTKAGRPEIDVKRELAREYGYFEVPFVEVSDYHTQFVDVPGELFDNTAAPAESRPASNAPPAPPLVVRVECKSKAQLVGMAKYDLYLRVDEPEGGSDRLQFALNFYKGAFGLWLRLCLLTGLAVALSCYLSGVITLLVAGALYTCGLATDFIRTVAYGTAPEGGPFLSILHMSRREVGVGSLPQDAASKKFAERSDELFRWLFRRFLDLIPDVDRYDLKSYVGEGFNVPWLQLFLSFGMAVGYVLPWIILGYYLIKWREVASTS